MADVITAPDSQSLANKIAAIAVAELNAAIKLYGNATWVLPGGKSPLEAFQVIASHHQDSVDWQNVRVLMGDERCVPSNHPDSNWGQASDVLLRHLGIPITNQIKPEGELGAKEAAARYESALSELPKTDDGLPRLDHVWLGIGEDGHTLSLFPGQESIWTANKPVIEVYNSPKLPPERISLSLQALRGTGSCLVFGVGDSKAPIVEKAQSGDVTLPITQAIQAIESSGGRVGWVVGH